MAWAFLLLASVIEILWAFTLKASEGFTRPGYVALMLICLVATTWLLSIVVKSLPLGTAYAVWVGIGMVGTAIVGMVFFHESASLPKIGAIGLIVAGVVALNLLES